MTKELKLAFLGCGAIARFHLDGISEHAPRISVTAAIDREAERAHAYAAETGGTAFTTLDAALNEGDFDAVDIMLPHDQHEDAARRCFEAGKHVLLEKPMAPTLEACERILAAAGKAGRVFMVAENAQYWPEIVTAAAAIEAGEIGDVITARASYVDEWSDYWYPTDDAWRYFLEHNGGGITIDGGSHWIRPLRLWLGEIDSVVAVVDRPLARMEGESLTRALFRFQSGNVATFEALVVKSVLAPDRWWRVTGTQGELTIDSGPTGVLRLWNREHPDGKVLLEPHGYTQSFGPMFVDFAAVVLDGKEPAAAAERALGELRTTLAIYRSAQSGNWENVW